MGCSSAIAYNTAVQFTTKYSPFSLLFGRDALSNIETLFPYTTPENLSLTDATWRFEECRQIARFPTLEAQAAAKLHYAEARRNAIYNDGDLVWLRVSNRTPGLDEKVTRKYIGPYHILKTLSGLTYVIGPVNPSSDRGCHSTGSADMS